MGFGQAIGSCFRNYAVLRGRAPRSEYWYFALFTFLVSLPAAIADKIVAPHQAEGPISGIVSLVLLLPQLAVTVRRLHDTNRSGWWFGGFVVYVIGALTVGLMVVLGPAGTGTKGPAADIVPAALLIGVVAYSIWLFVLMVLRGTDGANTYGPDPLAPRSPAP